MLLKNTLFFKLGFILMRLLITLPFIYPDLYIASSYDCITVNLKTWLQINGYFNLAMLGIGIYTVLKSKTSEHEMELEMVRIRYCHSLFRRVWLLYGIYIFYNYMTSGFYYCSTTVSIYMTIRLTLGVIYF
jgi:hypothetical protein